MYFPATKIRTSHAVSIRVNGSTIGQIQVWAPNQYRAVSPVYEIDAVGTGNPRENSIGTASNLTIQVARYDLYASKMEEIWGTSHAFWMLTDQFNPIDIEEKWIRWDEEKISGPLGWMNVGSKLDKWGQKVTQGIMKAKNAIYDKMDIPLEEVEKVEALYGYISYEKLWYSGCYFSQIGRNLQAQGDRIVMANATLNYTKVRPL